MTRDKKDEKKKIALPKIGAKEQKLFDHIHDMIFVDIDYCMENIYLKADGSPQSYSWVRRALRNFANAGYLKYFTIVDEEQAANSNKRVYTLDTKGVQEVQEIIGTKQWDMRWTDRTPTYIYHCLRGCAIRAAYEKPVNRKRNDKVIRYYGWVSERQSYFQYGPNKTEAIRPDATMLFEREVNDHLLYIPYFVEIERSRQSAMVSQNKLRRFEAYSEQKAYERHEGLEVPIRIPPRILFISNTDNEMNRLMAHTSEIATPHVQAVLYTTYDRLLQDPYGSIWKAKDASDRNRFYHFAEKVELAD